jgi:carboxyl-terminal processing protease
MEDKHPVIARNVTKLIEDMHYSRPQLDNSLSSAVLDGYLDTLDGNRMYFLASDIASFGKYRYELDDRTRMGQLDPVFEMFNLFRVRATERINYALELLGAEPDFSIDDEYRFDRSELGWPVSEEEMKEIWRTKVKSDGLTLVMTGKTWSEAAEILKKRYEGMHKRIAQLTADDVFETYMNAVAHTMDPHSSYLSPRQSEEYRIQMSLSYDGIGASLQTGDDYVTIVNIIPGGPAHIDGRLKPEDRITAVAEGDGEFVDVIGWRLDEVVQMIRGPSGTRVRLQILPAGMPPGGTQKIVELTRDKVKLEEQAAKSELVEVPFEGEAYRIGVITVPSFYQDFSARSRGEEDYTSTSRDVARLIGELEAQGIDGIVMDLRQNGGGHLSEATELSGLFIDGGPVVQLRQTRGNIEILEDPSDTAIYDGPLAVLVDRFSASASEIFAAAIQDYERGVIIGQQTFGKGSVQNLFNLDRMLEGGNNGQLTLTIGKYYRVTGESTQNRGVVPDVELPSSFDVEIVGENTRPTALPWDRIQPTRFRAGKPLDPEITVLQDHQARYAANDPDYEYLLKEFAFAERDRGVVSVSLNLAEREREALELEQAQLAHENERRAALGLEPLASVEELESAPTTDAILLVQATRMVAEMASSRGLATAVVEHRAARQQPHPLSRRWQRRACRASGARKKDPVVVVEDVDPQRCRSRAVQTVSISPSKEILISTQSGRGSSPYRAIFHLVDQQVRALLDVIRQRLRRAQSSIRSRIRSTIRSQELRSPNFRLGNGAFRGCFRE